MNWKNRLKNYGFWIGVIALILFTLDQFGFSLFKTEYSGIVDIILAILVLLGIINNPTTNNRGFCDD